jgi:hypothetical protein
MPAKEMNARLSSLYSANEKLVLLSFIIKIIEVFCFFFYCVVITLLKKMAKSTCRKFSLVTVKMKLLQKLL